METTWVKINLYTGEIELEGSEKFVENQLENLDSIIELISSVRKTEKTKINHDVNDEQ